MLAPLIEAKPYERELFDLMLDSKEIWDKFLKKEFITQTKLKKNASLHLLPNNKDDEERIIFKRRFFKQLGFETQILDSKTTLEIEPNINSNIYCSLLCEKHNQIEPLPLIKYLFDQIKKMGGEVEKFNKIENFSFSKGKLRIQDSYYEAEKIVIACGVWSSKLLEKSIGITLSYKTNKRYFDAFKTNKKLFSNNIWFRNIYLALRDF